MRIKPLAKIAALTIAAALAACETIPLSSHRTDTERFNPSSVAWSKRTGTNAITGVARLETDSGKLRTCAALPVRLAPDSNYTRERVQQLYGDADAAFVDAQEAKRARAQTSGVSRAYESSLKAAMCDAKGRFVFKNLPDGTYYVMAPVVWRGKLGEVSEGGFFMQRVTVQGGETARVQLAMQ